MGQNSLFSSFWQAGFECSTHRLKTGKRLDLVAATSHDRFAESDFLRLKSVGIRTAREGLRWHLIECEPGVYDFSSVVPILSAARKQGIEIIWDLFHFGWPDYLNIFSSEWLDSFVRLASKFAQLLVKMSFESAFIAPINEISFFSWAGGDTGYLNPFEKNRGPELKRQLVRAYLGASQELRVQHPGVRLVSPEPVIHIVGNPDNPRDIKSAEEYRSAMFEAWDMIAGRAQPELGGREQYLDVLGLNYYDRNQWWNFGKTIWRHEPQYRPFREVIAEVYSRYRRPLFISETGTEDQDRPGWLAYIAGETDAAIESGSPVEGICWYPILNHPGWDDDRHCCNGLWDYAGPDGSRDIYQPLADELSRHQEQGEPNAKVHIYPGGDAERSAVHVSSTMELRLSTAAASDEPVC